MADLTKIEKEIRRLSKQGGHGHGQLSIPNVKVLKHKQKLLKILKKNPHNIIYINLIHKGTITADDRTIELGEIEIDNIDWEFTGNWTYGAYK